MAGVTEDIGLAVDVLNVSLRHPFLLAGQRAVAQAASGGRVEVGLGAGSHELARFDHAALKRPLPPLAERLGRLARCCQAFPTALAWRAGERRRTRARGCVPGAAGDQAATDHRRRPQ